MPGSAAGRREPALVGPVLVAEDETLVAMHLVALIEGRGYSVLGPAARLDAALGLIAATPDIGLAVLDVNLAGQLIDPVADLLGARGVPFLFLTGYEADELPLAHRDRPHLIKPVEDQRMLSMIEEIRAA